MTVRPREGTPAATLFPNDRPAAQAASRAELWTAMLDGEPPHPAPPRAVGPGWACHVHVNDTPVQLTSRAGRYYRMCSIRGCMDFEK